MANVKDRDKVFHKTVKADIELWISQMDHPERYRPFSYADDSDKARRKRKAFKRYRDLPKRRKAL